MRKCQFFDANKIEGPKKKILEFIEADNMFEEKEKKWLAYLFEALENIKVYK